MKVYVDLLLLFNFIIDLLLLMSVSLLLKRPTSFYRLTLGAFLGSFSIIILFLPISNLLLFFLKIGMSMILIIVTFSYRTISYFLKNLGYFYFASMVLGGMIYLWNTTFSYEGVTNSFIANSYQLNFFGLLLLSPICIAYYVRKMRSMQEKYLFYKKVSFQYQNTKIEGIGYIDSGNTLTCKGRPVILGTDIKLSDFTTTICIPYQTIQGTSILKCILLKEVDIEGKIWKNIYLGMIEETIKIEGIDFLLHHSMIGACDETIPKNMAVS